jgi:hypothetical protein
MAPASLFRRQHPFRAVPLASRTKSPPFRFEVGALHVLYQDARILKRIALQSDRVIARGGVICWVLAGLSSSSSG